jgi:hypothetical protein
MARPAMSLSRGYYLKRWLTLAQFPIQPTPLQQPIQDVVRVFSLQTA